jgi:membrane protease subunit (stomatin/prohibitin family)
MAIIDRIKYDAKSKDELVGKFSSEELRLGSQLIVNQSQEAIFVKGGKALDVFLPGTHTLSTKNIPILGKLINLPFGGKTPFTAEVWFVTKTIKRDLKWGTTKPIPILDPLLNYLINVRAFGQWGIRITDTRVFVQEMVGTLTEANNERVHEYFIGEIVQKLSNSLSLLFTKENVSIVEANSKLNELSATVAKEITDEFNRFGMEIINFNIQRINIPDEDTRKIQEVLAKKMEMEQLGKVQVGQGYITARTFDTLEKAAENEGAAGGMLAGGFGIGAGLGAGMPIGKQIGQTMNIPDANKDDPAMKLESLKKMLDAGLISSKEYEAKKKQILDSI